MLQQRDHHRRHRAEHRRPLGLEQLEHQRRVEREHRHVRREGLHGAEHAHRAARGVEHRHRIDVDLAGLQADPLRVEAGVVGEPAMMQLSTLGKAGRAGGVLDLRDIAGLHLRQLSDGWRRAQEVVPLGEQNDLPESRHVRPHLVQELRHRAAVLRHQEDARRAGLVQHVAELGRAQRRIHGHQDEPGQRGGVLEDDPLGQVRRPRRDPLTRREPHGERAGSLLGVGKKPGVGPPLAAGRIGQAADHGQPVRCRRCRRAQHAADSGIEDLLRGVGRPV